MRLSSRSKLSILLSVVTFVTIIGAIVLTAVPRGPAIHAAGPGHSTTNQATNGGSGPHAIRGTATKVGSSSLSTGSQPTQGTPLKRSAVRKLVDPLDSNGPIPAENASSVPSGQGVSLADPPAGALLQNFNGVSSRDSEDANFVDGVTVADEPPDQGLCVGPSSFFDQEIVIEPVNLAFAIYATDGTRLAGPFALNTLFHEPSFLTEFISDPRCVFDPATGDFFFTIIAFPATSPTNSHLDITVFNPNLASLVGSLMVYRLDTTDLGSPGCPCQPDTPNLGLDQFNIYVSHNEFSFQTGTFTGSNVFAISKSQLAAFATTVNFAEFLHLSDAGIPILGLQPAISTGNPPAEYLVHSFAVNASGFFLASSNFLGVFAITNRQVVSSGGIPTLLGPVMTKSEGYAQPRSAPSTGGVTLDGGDDRLQQVQFINGRLWASLSTSFFFAPNLTGSCVNNVCDSAAWFQITPALIQNLLLGAQVTQQGYVAVPNVSILYPAIVQSPNGTVDMAFSVTSPTLNPSAAFAVNVNQVGFSAVGHVFVAATGTGPDTGFTCTPGPCRWGDYSGATLDPISNNIWMGSEYIPPVSSQGIDINWGTRIYEIAA